jgi:HK97 family phage prohead protease
MPYKDYPEGAVNNAKRCLKWVEENGWGSCGTDVGKRRASQIANRQSLSDSTVKRVYSFLSRHAENADVPYSEGCGGLMYDAWGGKAMLRWARGKVNEMNEKKMDDTHLENYVRRSLHNISRRTDRATYMQLVAIYTNTPGTDKERIAEVRKFISGVAERKMEKATSNGVQYRAAEMRAAESEDEMIVEGYAAVFDSVTDIGPFQERIAPGAFSDVLDDDVRLLINHDGVPLARTTNGTLELKQDDTGLHYRAVLSNTQAGKDLYEMIKRGDINQSSFAFMIGEESRDENDVRVIDKVSQLIDVSPVTYPAYQAASVFARAEEKEEEND